MSFMSADILLAKAFLILVAFFAINLFFILTFFLVIFNMAPGLYFAADFNLFNCVFVSLTYDNLASFRRLLNFYEKS